MPLNTPTTYEKTKAFAQRIAEQMSVSAPGMIVSQMRRALRPGKVFIDWTAEVQKYARSRDPHTLVFDANCPERRTLTRATPTRCAIKGP